MGKTSFQSLDQLVKNISDNINLLNNGQLNSSEIETLTENTKDLYERLIVIRHKAYEKFGKTETEINPIVENLADSIPDSSEAIIFDSIATEPVQEDKKEVVEEMMSFDFSEPIEEVKSTIEPEPIVEAVEAVLTVEEKTIKQESSINESITGGSASLNDGFKSSNSLGDRLNQTKIDDLKSAIGINKKFNFITNLFSGSNEEYNEAIDSLNNCIHSDQARSLLGDLAEKNNWDVEEKTVLSFVELIERRYM